MELLLIMEIIYVDEKQWDEDDAAVNVVHLFKFI